MRSTFLPFALPDIDETELDEIKEALDSGWITTGPKVLRFEKEFSSSVNSKNAVAVNSCTAAMHLALEAVGMKSGDEVITSPYTFAASAEVIRYFDAKPVFVDVRPDDFNIDPLLIVEKINNRTRAIIPVHVGGLPAELDEIYQIAARNNLAVVEDAAHGFPAKYRDRTIGSDLIDPGPDRHITCFSFYATKSVTTAEGGMLTTADGELAERCRIMSLHGISKDAWKRYTAEGSWYYEIVAPGYKYNMTDIAAAMGLAQLAKAVRMRDRRAEIARQYNEAFRNLPALQAPFDRDDCQHAWHLYMLRLNLERLKIDRSQFIIELKDRNIGASVHFIPLHMHPYYREKYGLQPEDFPVARNEYKREISLPIYSRMSDQDAADVIEAVLGIVEQFGC
ncbi:MAG: DegT/DnrJ/EryC1/StrS aminotransferase family protein [Anaerolineales bacterium]|nr:DegT/DnrJ/EryC1/StrS aminotransferase family protein [Anaerolineales bacterium]